MKFDAKYVLIGLFCIFCGKYFTQSDITLYQTLELFIIGGLAAFYEHKSSVKDNSENKKLIEDIKRELADTQKIQKDIINNVSSLKINAQRSSQRL